MINKLFYDFIKKILVAQYNFTEFEKKYEIVFKKFLATIIGRRQKYIRIIF